MESLDLTIHCWRSIAETLYKQVLNVNYYPLATEEQLQKLIELNIDRNIYNLYFPYQQYDNAWIVQQRKDIEKRIDEYLIDNYLLYIRNNEEYQQLREYIDNSMLNFV